MLLNTTRVEPGFLVWLSNSSWYRRLMRATAVGSTQIHIRNSEFLRLRIPLPPMDEQARVVAAFSKLNTGIQKNEKVVRRFQQVKAGLLQDLLTGKVRVSV